MKSEVVLEVDSGTQAVLRHGRVVGGSGLKREIEWASGDRETAKLGRDAGVLRLAMPAGGLRHLARTDRARVQRLLRTAPEDVFAMALRDSQKPMASRELIAAVEQLFPEAAASEKWKRCRFTFQAREDVEARGEGASLRFKFVESSDVVVPEPVSDETAARPSVPAPGGLAVGASSGVDVEEESSLDPAPREKAAETAGRRIADSGVSSEGTSPVAAVAVVPTDDAVVKEALRRLAKGKKSAQPSEEVRAAARRAGPAVELVLHAMANGPDQGVRASLVAAALRHPLQSGASLGDLPDEVVATATKSLSGMELVVLMGFPRPNKDVDAVDALALLGPDPALALLRVAAGEVRRRPSQTSGMPGQATYASLCRRLLTSEGGRRLRPVQILEAIEALPTDWEESWGVSLSELLLRSLVELGPEAWANVEPPARRDIAHRIRRAPLGRTTARARLLSWLWTNDKPEALNGQWWANVTFDELAELAVGPLGAALETPQLVDRLVTPLVRSALTEADTRKRLFAVLSAPPLLLRVLTSAEVGDSLRRVLGFEEVGRSWLADVGRASLLQSLETEVQSLRNKLANAAETAASARAAESEARERALRIEARLAEAATSTEELRGSQTRQAQIEVLRSLAVVGSYVATALAEGREPARIEQRLNGLLAREGLVPIGAVGEEQSYVPAEHDLIGADQSVETPVIITAIGYKVSVPGNEDLVLIKALVTPRT